MSVVVAVKYKNGVCLAADRQSTAGTTKSDNATKIQAFNYSQTAIGTVGYLRDCNIMRTIDEIVPLKDILDQTPIDELYVIKTIAPEICNQLRTNHRLSTENGLEYMNSEMLFATRDKIFTIGADFGVREADEYFDTIGCGEDKVRGFLTAVGDTSNYTKNQITDVVCEAIRRGCEKDVFVNDKINIVYLEGDEPNDQNQKIKKR